MEPQNHPHRFVNCYYFDFEITSRGVLPKLVKQKMEIKNYCYYPQDIYGMEEINGSSLLTKDSIAQCCKICLDKIISIIVLPCRHMCLCLDCAKLYNEKGKDNHKKMKSECPVCKTKIEGFLNIHGKKIFGNKDYELDLKN